METLLLGIWWAGKLEWERPARDDNYRLGCQWEFTTLSFFSGIGFIVSYSKCNIFQVSEIMESEITATGTIPVYMSEKAEMASLGTYKTCLGKELSWIGLSSEPIPAPLTMTGHSLSLSSVTDVVNYCSILGISGREFCNQLSLDNCRMWFLKGSLWLRKEVCV